MSDDNVLSKALKLWANRYGDSFDQSKAEELLKFQNSSEQELRKSHDHTEQISVEILAEPYSPDAHGHWYSEETIKKGYQNAVKAQEEGRLNMNLFHAYDDKDQKYLRLEKQYLVDEESEYNGELVKKGSWVAEVKWLDNELWKKRITPLEDGMPEIAGLSLRGWGVINSPQSLEKSSSGFDIFEYYELEAESSWSDILKATTESVTKDDKGNLVYRGQKFPGYNKPMKDSGNKQGKVLAKKGDEIKIVRFGDPSLPDNQSAEQNDQFYARFGNQKGMDDKFSALFWSASHLWPRGKLKGKGAKEFYKLK